MPYAIPIARLACIAIFLGGIGYYHASVLLGFGSTDVLSGSYPGSLVLVSGALAVLLYSMNGTFDVIPRSSAANQRIAAAMPGVYAKIRSMLDPFRSRGVLGLVQVLVAAFFVSQMVRANAVTGGPSSEILAYSLPPLVELLVFLIGGACLLLAVMDAEIGRDDVAEERLLVDEIDEEVSLTQSFRWHDSWAREVLASGDLRQVVWLVSVGLVSVAYLGFFVAHLFVGEGWLGTVSLYGLGAVNTSTLVVFSPLLLSIVASPCALIALLILERRRGSDNV